MSNQGARQASVRAVTGTAFTYEGDWHALFDMAEIPAGTFNERMLAWINDYMGESFTELNGAMAAFAIDQGADSWNGLGTFDAGGVVPPVLRVASTNSNLPCGRQAVNSSRCFVQRTRHKLGGELNAVYALIPGSWYYTNAGDADLGNDVSFDKVALEISGTTVPILFSGGRTLTTGAEDYYLSDKIEPSAFSLSSFAAETTVSLRAQGSVAASGMYIAVGSPSNTGGDTAANSARMYMYDPAVTNPDPVDGTGYIPKPTGATQRNRAQPIFLVGEYVDGDERTLALLGDSIGWGLGDNDFGGQSEFGGLGLLGRATVGSGKSFAAINMCCPSETANQFNNPVQSARRRNFLKFCTDAVVQYGTNDLGQTGSASEATVQAFITTTCSTIRTYGINEIVYSNLLCSASSSNSWVDKAGQTPRNGWDAAVPKRDNINAWMLTQIGVQFSGVADVLSVISDPTDNHYFLSNGTANYATQDGIHLRVATYVLGSAELRDTLLSVLDL